MALNYDHTLIVRAMTADGELILSENDFAEEAAYEWFEQNVLMAEAGEVIQLIDTSDDRVLAEKRK